MNAFEKIKKLDDATEAAKDSVQTVHETTFEAILISEGMKAFVLWANAFPKRHLRFVSGMGTSTFACPSIDNSCFLTDIDDYCEGVITCGYSAKVGEMIKPIIDFYKLFWSSDMYLYPAMHDFLYNPVTRTVEYHDQIIYLDK